MKHILIGSTNQDACKTIRSCLGGSYRVETAGDRNGCLELFHKNKYEFVFIDLEFIGTGNNGPEANSYKVGLLEFWNRHPSAQIVVLSPLERIREAVNAVKAGAGNYLTFPLNPEEVRYVIESTEEFIHQQKELDYLRDRFWNPDALRLTQTRSRLMREVFERVKAVAPTKATALLMGETGTGKGVLAKLIHQHSQRAERSFIAVHCGAIPETLVESELFGHEKGAFTGASKRKLGRFEIAHGGTIFLDEIGTVSPPTQVKLLQVLQDGTFQRVGGELTLKTDVRVVSASNIDLKTMSDDGRFRSDLYYRLNVFPIEVPALRERIEDVPLLAEFFLKRLNQFHSKNISGVHPEVIEAFERYSWPGNIRELENIMERAYILERSAILTPQSFPADIIRASRPCHAPHQVDTSVPLAEARRKAVEDVDQAYLTQLLTLNRGRIDSTARAIGISTRQLNKLMTKYGLRKEDFK